MSSAEDSFNCVFCNESFTDKELLQIHFRKHGDPQFRRESPSKNKMAEHVQGPEAVTEKKFELVSCDVCPEVFATISKAITHKHKVHPDHDAKYFCCWCGKLFTLKHLYNKHLISHETQSRGIGSFYHCDSCNVNFNIPSAMTYHNKIFHRQDTDLSTIGQSTKQKLLDQELCQVYYCAFCGEEYINKVNLHKHMTDDHSDENQGPNDVLRCPLCQAIFYHLDAYEVHLTFHSAEDVYHDNVRKMELSEYTLDSVPPLTEKVENYESEPEAKSSADNMNIDDLLQLASEGATKKKQKKHKKHKKSKKSAITLDEFLNMNTDVFGEGLNFQGVEEVPTQVVSKRLKGVKGATAGATVKKELDKLKQQGIVIKKKSNKVPVFPGVKVQLGMQNKVQRPLKIAPCALKPLSNSPYTESQLKKIMPKTNEEVISKLLNQSHSQIQIIKKPVLKTTEDSVLESLSETPEKIEVECDLLLRSSEPSSELDPEDYMGENKSDGLAYTSILPDPTSTSIKESEITNKQLCRKNEESDNSTKTSGSLEQEASDASNITNLNGEILMDSKTTDGKKNLDSLKALKNIQHLTIKQLKPPESNLVQKPCISNAMTEEDIEKDITEPDLEDAIPATKIVNSTSPNKSQAKTKSTEENNAKNLTQKPVITSICQPSTNMKQDKNEEDNTEKRITNTVTVKSNTTEEKPNVHVNTEKKAADFLKNISQHISIKPVCTNIVKPSTLPGPSKETHGLTSTKTTDALKNLSKHITVKPVPQAAITSNNGEAKIVETGAKKVIPIPQGNIKHFPQITVTSLSKKVADNNNCKQCESDEDYDEFDSDVDNDMKPSNSKAVSNIGDSKNRNQQQMQHSQQSVTKTNKISQNVLNNKQITIKSSNQTFTSTSTNVKESYDEAEADIVPKHENIPLPSYEQTLQGKLLNMNVAMKSARSNSRENTIQYPCHSPNPRKVLPANDRTPITNDDISNRIGLLQKLNQGITIKTTPQKKKIVTEQPVIFNIDDSDSDDDTAPAVPTNSQNPMHDNRLNLTSQKNISESSTSVHSTKQREQLLQPRKQHNQQQAIPSGVQQKWQLVKHTAQSIIKSDDDMQDDYFSTDEDQQNQHSDSDDSPEICPNVSKLLSNKNISLKNMQGYVTQALKQPIPSGQQFHGKAVKEFQNDESKSLLKDFHFNESSEDDEAATSLNNMKTTGKELAIRQSDEVTSDNDDDNFEDMNENEDASFKNHNQDVINKLRSLNANISFKSNNPSGQQILNKMNQNSSDSVAMKSSSNHSNKTVTYSQSRAVKRESSESFSGNTNIRKDLTSKPCKQIKVADEEPQSEDMSTSSVNQSKTLSKWSDINTVNQEITTSVKTIQTKTVVQEITTTVTRTIKTVNQEVAVTSTQVAGNASVTKVPRMPKFIQGMPRTPAQVRNVGNAGTPLRPRVPNTANIRPSNPTRASVNTAIRSPNNTPRMRPAGVQQVRLGTSRMPMIKKVPAAQGNQSQNNSASKPIKMAPNVVKQQQQPQRQQSVKRISEPDGPFSCFKKPNESLLPSGFASDITASTSQICNSNFSRSTKTFKSDSFSTATKTKSEVHGSHQEIKKLSNLSGINVVRSSQSSHDIKEIQKVVVSDPKSQSTLEAIQKLQKQGLLLKKPRLEEPDECEQSDSGCEDNDNPN